MSTPGNPEDDRSFYGALLTLDEDSLLLPNSLLAEVVPGERLHAGAGDPNWLGTVDWNGAALPVLSFERLNRHRAPEASDRRVRLVVLHAFDEHLPARAWALRCVGFPRMIPLSPTALERVALHDDDRPDLVLARVRIGVREMAIPDLDRIEADLMAARLRAS